MKRKFDVSGIIVIALVLLIFGILVKSITTVSYGMEMRRNSNVSEYVCWFEKYEKSKEKKSDSSYSLTKAERDIVERVVMSEAGDQDFDGQCLVAQCILNTALARNMRPNAVVLEKNQYAKPYRYASDTTKKAVSAVFDDGYRVTNEPIRFFYDWRYGYGKFHETKCTFVLKHGCHKFFKAGK